MGAVEVVQGEGEVGKKVFPLSGGELFQVGRGEGVHFGDVAVDGGDGVVLNPRDRKKRSYNCSHLWRILRPSASSLAAAYSFVCLTRFSLPNANCIQT